MPSRAYTGGMRLAVAAVVSSLFLGCGSVVIEPGSSGGAGSTSSSSVSASGVTTTSASTGSLSSQNDASATSASSGASTGSSTPADCTAKNYLSHDSFDVVAAALADCINAGTGCPTHTATSILLPNLGEGNGDVTFDYATNGDGTHSLVGHGNPEAVNAPPGVILEADLIPASVSLDDALGNFYFDSMSFACTWQ